MADIGWIKLHRKMLEWEWFTEPNTAHLFLYLLLAANHEDKKWRGQLIKRGQIITGRHVLSEETGLSERTIRTCLERLKSTNEIAVESTSQFSIITINKYSTYQLSQLENDQQKCQTIDQRPTNDRPTTDQRPTTNKNTKNDKNIKRGEDNTHSNSIKGEQENHSAPTPVILQKKTKAEEIHELRLAERAFGKCCTYCGNSRTDGLKMLWRKAQPFCSPLHADKWETEQRAKSKEAQSA